MKWKKKNEMKWKSAVDYDKFWWIFLFFFFFQLPVTDPTQFAEHLFLTHETFEKLLFPNGVDETLGVEQSLGQSWLKYAANVQAWGS